MPLPALTFDAHHQIDLGEVEIGEVLTGSIVHGPFVDEHDRIGREHILRDPLEPAARQSRLGPILRGDPAIRRSGVIG